MPHPRRTESPGRSRGSSSLDWRGPCSTVEAAHGNGTPAGTFVAATAVAAALAIQPAFARVDVNVEFDKAFDFKSVRTWGWNPRGAGEIEVARTQQDDPEAMRARAEPVILDEVTAAIGRRGVAQTNITFDADNEKRESLLREGVRDLLAKYPPRR